MLSAAMRPNDLCTAAFYGDLAKVKELLAVEPVEEEPPLDDDFDPLAPPDDEAEAAAAERWERRAANERTIAARLGRQDTLRTRQSVVDVRRFGLGVVVTEEAMRCQLQFKPSDKVPDTATPLHWAVLGCEHDVVRHLILAGADPEALTATLGVTPRAIIDANSLAATRSCFDKALAERAGVVAASSAAREAHQAEVQRRDDLRAEAKRRAEEEEAAAAAREEAEEAEEAED